METKAHLDATRCDAAHVAANIRLICMPSSPSGSFLLFRLWRLSVLSLRKQTPPSARRGKKKETIRKGCVCTIASSPFMLPASFAQPGPLISACKLNMTFFFFLSFFSDNRAGRRPLSHAAARLPLASRTRSGRFMLKRLALSRQQQRRSRLFSPRSNLVQCWCRLAAESRHSVSL